MTTYDSVRKRFGNIPKTSFLVIDGEIVSEAEPDGVGSAGRNGYDSHYAKVLTQKYHDLLRVSGEPLRDKELDDPLIGLKKLRGESPTQMQVNE